MNYSGIAVVALIFASVHFCDGKLSPLQVFNDDLATLMMPNERQSLDDCHLRYYKYGYSGYTSGPTFKQPKPTSKEFAHLAAVGKSQNDGTVRWICGGSLIWENFVLTSARCVTTSEVEPDVVRLGDDQQIKISEIIVQPSFRREQPAYNDVALLRLEQDANISPTNAPACLWKEQNVPFPTMQAVGWANLDNLLPSKITLKRAGSAACNRAGLSEGVKDHQICARHDKLTECPLGTGGSLQRMLFHNGKLTPFLVGIASQEITCDSTGPAAYTKVSHFYDWITDTIEQKEPSYRDWRIDPTGCAFLRSYLRDHEKEEIVAEVGDEQTIDVSKALLTYGDNEFNHVVGIHWSNYNYRRENCTGTLVADDTVLVLAECTSNYGVAATHVYVGWLLTTENYPIAETHIHPEYMEGSPYNNIAILKLGKRIKFNPIVRPACIWTSGEIPATQVGVLGRGRQDLNFFVRDDQFESFWPMDTNVTARLDIYSASNCPLTQEDRRKLNRGISPELLCAGNPNFLVPLTCQLLSGAPVQLPINRADRFFNYAVALNQLGSACGFGEPTVSTRLASHINWLQTILLPNYRDESVAVQYVNPDWDENETCTYDFEDEIEGTCIQYTKCPKVWDDFKAKRRIHFCNSASVICCPKRYIVKEGRKPSDVLDTCLADFSQFHQTQNSKSFPYLVTLTWNNSPKRCLASLITTQLVITSASCVSSNPGNPTQGILADRSSVSLETPVMHPNYHQSEIVDDIAVLKLSRAVIPSAKVFPACIWMNLTHTPLNLKLLVEAKNSTSTRQVTPMYTTDCQRDYKRKLTADHLCVDELAIQVDSSCSRVGDQLVWYGGEGSTVPYLVGFHSFGERCEEGNPGVFTRVAGYVDWVREQL